MGIGKFVHDYFKRLHHYNPKTDNEHTYRTDLQNLLRLVCTDIAKDVEPRQEVKDGQAQLGVPDFSFINSKTLGTVGLLENKAIGADIEKLVSSAQVKKYRKRNENIILTNYHDWLLVKDGKITHRCTLGSLKEIKAKAYPVDDDIAALQNLLSAFLSESPKGIGRKKELAEQLALRCHDLREFLIREMERQKKAKIQSPLWDMFDAFQQYIDSQLTPETFADAFAQTLGYSLFLAKLNVHPENTNITLYNVQKFIPSNFGLIRALANFLKELEEDNYLPIRHRVEEILGMMNTLYLGEIINDLSFNKTLPLGGDEEARLFERDPYIYFYEYFLKEYDSKVSEQRGVYYTPPPVVNFIIRGINQIVKERFGITDGLADAAQVQLLDFATGTGTFLVETIQQMFEYPDIAGSKPLQKSLVNDHILKNLYGFEYLIAPYTIAHLKLSKFLKGKGFESDKTQQIYLTNTLEMKSPQGDFPFMQKLKEESAAAHRVKEMPILVITGNPPYSGASQNTGGEIDDLTKDAYAPADEKKMNWDDYVKFIRFAHHKMEKVERGVIGVITNNSFLNAVTLRQMRNRLMKDFNAIYVLNLHGNNLIGELAPDGKLDKSVFDIRVGTVITFLVKTELKPTKCDIYYGAIKSSKQLDKYKQLAAGDLSLFEPLNVTAFNERFAATRWSNRFEEALSFFIPSQDDYAEKLAAYGDFWGVTDIFKEYGSGVKTERDYISIQQTQEDIEAVVKDFIALSEADLDAKYQKPYNKSDSRDWSVKKAKADIETHKGHNLYTNILYRPFDLRRTYYTGVSRGFIGTPGAKIGGQMLHQDSIGLMTCRLLVSDTWQHIMATNYIAESSYLSTQSREFGYLFPLFLYPPKDGGDLLSSTEKQENLKPDFRRWLDKHYGKKYTPEQILGYIYAVLHSPIFRTRYQELLKIDFPRIPFVKKAAEFEILSAFGGELIEAHLLKTVPDGTKVTFPIEGDNKVENVNYQLPTQRLYINENQYFDNVPPEVWGFTIGGYQVLEKYLKERKKAGRALGLQELKHIPKVARILEFTQQQMKQIDEAFDCP